MRELCLAAALSLCTAASTVNAAPALQNPSFEEPHARLAGMPAGWSWGKVYGNGPTHFEWSADAMAGRRSFRMTSLHVTQYVQQHLKLRPGTQYTFRVHAKGSGKLRFAVQALAGRKPIHKTAQADWTLTDRWLDYEISGIVPAGSETMRLMALTPMTGCDVFLDDAQVRLGRPESRPQPPGPRPSPGLFDLTPLCRLECIPYAGTSLDELCDGETRWGGLRPEHRTGRGARFVFRFPKPAELAAVEFVQGKPAYATSYLIDADTTGDGQFDTTLVRVSGSGRGEVRTLHSFARTRAQAVRFCGLQGPDRYGRCYPSMREFAVLVAREPWMKEPLRPVLQPIGPAELEPHGTPRSLPDVSRDLAAPMAQRTARGVFVEAWMFGLGKSTPPPFDKLTRLEQFLWQLDYVGADHVMLFPSRSGTSGCPVWPSRFVEGSAWDALCPLVDTLKRHDIRTFVIFGRTSKLLQPKLSWPRWFGGLLAEVAASGAHGASVCADEFPQCGGEPDPAVYQAALKRELGLEQRPAVREDAQAYRKWMLFHYRQIALAHKQAGEQALAANPDFLFFSNWRVDPVALNSTYGVLAYDVLGRHSGISYFGTDPYYSEARRRVYMERTVKLLAAAARPRGALPVLKGGSWDFEHLDRYPGILLNGSAIASVMHGAAGVSFYRLNYLFMNNKAHLVREAFRMIEWLDQAGLRDTRPPQAIAVLHSRASEDFWQLRQEMSRGNDLRVAGIRGYVAQKAIEEFMLRHSYPFVIHYLEREDELADLGRYRAVVLPFPYCISDKAAAAVEVARNAGARVMLCERLGEANEIGTLRAKPALDGWRNRDRVEYVDNIVDRMTAPQFRADLAQAFDRLLGEHKPFDLWKHGQNVEAIVRERPDGQKLLALINWERGDVVFDAGLRLPEGSYRVSQCDGYGVRPAAIAGRVDLTADDLAKFRVQLERDQVRLYDVRPSPK